MNSTSARGVSQPGKTRIAHWLVVGFFVTTVLAPAAFFNKVFFVLILGWLGLDLIGTKRPLATWSPLLIIVIFAYGLILARLGVTDTPISVQYFTSTLVLITFYFVHRHGVALDDIVVNTCVILVVGMVMFWLSVVGAGFPGRDLVFDFFDSYNFSSATDREFFDGGAIFTLQLGTTPFLLIGAAVLIFRYGRPEQRRFDRWLIALFLGAILVSGLRGLLVVLLGLIVGFAFYRAKPIPRLLLTLAIAIGGAIAYLALRETLIFSSQEVSNAVKIGHYQSFFDQMTIPKFLLGEGLGSYYYSAGTASLRSYTELTPFDIARYVGVPLTIVLYLAFLFPYLKSSYYMKEGCLYVLTMTMFIALSFTNPVMVNSYGMLVVVWYWRKLLDVRGATT
jgi:hypothetical protein